MLGYNANPADTANANAVQTMRLRDDPPPITPAARTSRKRKSPPENATTPVENQQLPQQQQPPPPPPPQQPQMHHVLPPMMPHPMQGGPPLPPGYHYADFTPGGIPPQGDPSQHQPHDQSPPPNSAAGRALSSSKRAEQNRKAQRAFRERRDQHVKALESRSQLLDAALASADEANRRWEECRALVDQLRVENTALRAALSQAQLLPPGMGGPPPQLQQQQQQQQSNGSATNGLQQQHNNGAQLEAATRSLEAVVNELKTDSVEATMEQKHE